MRTVVFLAPCLFACGCTSRSDMTFKDDVVAHFAKNGIRLREVDHTSNYIEYCFRVGPDYKYAVGMNVMETAEEKTRFQPQEYPLPSYAKHDVILWRWNLDESNATPDYEALFEQLKNVLNTYPGCPTSHAR